MITTTIDYVPNREIGELLGIARGSTVRSRHLGRDITAMFKNIVGGEIEEYTKLQADAREQALQRLVKDAERLGADAVIGLRITTTVVSQGSAEILVYGTAVKLK
ncbi:MAG: YbjQ family protein [Candidatus Paceibacterota bacterium]